MHAYDMNMHAVGYVYDFLACDCVSSPDYDFICPKMLHSYSNDSVQLTWALNSSILKMSTVMITNSIVTAAQKRGLCSTTLHIIQKYRTSPLSKGSSGKGLGYYKEIKVAGNSILFPHQIM